jgi:GNAT superfamily N-acetyltransferase
MEIRELTSEAERREAVPILRQLWEHKTDEQVFAWTGEAEYTLLGGFVDGSLVGVAGLVVQSVLHHERHAWLYDLVVDEQDREQGHGSALLAAVEEWADARDCATVALASPLDKESVHEYYESREYERWGYLFEKPL